MEIISFLGTLFSGLSLYLQLAEKNPKEANLKFLNLLGSLSKYLRYSKNLHHLAHHGLHENNGSSFQSFNKAVDAVPTSSVAEIWNKFYDSYLREYEQKNFDVIESSDFEIKRAGGQNEISIIREIGAETEIKVITKVFPQAYLVLIELNRVLEQYDKDIRDKKVPYSENVKVIELFETLIFRSDRLIMNQIDLFSKIMIYLGKGQY